MSDHKQYRQPTAADIKERLLIGQRMRRCREYLGMTQEDVAACLGVKRPIYTLMESGERKVEAIELSRLARLYQRPVDYFLGTEPVVPNSLAGLDLTSLDPHDHDELVKFAEYLAWRKRAKDEQAQKPPV